MRVNELLDSNACLTSGAHSRRYKPAWGKGWGQILCLENRGGKRSGYDATSSVASGVAADARHK